MTENSKTFNPPGTIYHTEAERIEAWGLDHITKAASTVIQYETDWNIEVERDDDNQHVSIDDDDEPPTIATPMDVDEPGLGGPASFITPQTHTMSGRRTRGPYKKAGAHPNVPARHTISESIDAEGHLPGFKDGLGAFPAGSDWARMMLQLKLKGISSFTPLPSQSELCVLRRVTQRSFRKEVQNQKGALADRERWPPYATGWNIGLYGKYVNLVFRICQLSDRPSPISLVMEQWKIRFQYWFPSYRNRCKDPLLHQLTLQLNMWPRPHQSMTLICHHPT